MDTSYSPIDNSKKYKVMFYNSSPPVTIVFTEKNEIHDEEYYFDCCTLECYIIDEIGEENMRAVYHYHNKNDISYLQYNDIDNNKIILEILHIYQKE